MAKRPRGTQASTNRKPSVHGELRSGPIAGTALIVSVIGLVRSLGG